MAVGGELGDIGAQANCLGKICMVLASKGDLNGAVKVRVDRHACLHICEHGIMYLVVARNLLLLASK